MLVIDLEQELAALAEMPLGKMRTHWTAVTGKPIPRVRLTLLRLALAFELQANVHGGLSRRAEQRLAYLAHKQTSETTTTPGTRLLREWNGVLHTVVIDMEGTIQWDGRTWRSLSEVARAITGTRWSGPAFFGLKPRKLAA